MYPYDIKKGVKLWNTLSDEPSQHDSIKKQHKNMFLQGTECALFKHYVCLYMYVCVHLCVYIHL